MFHRHSNFCIVISVHVCLINWARLCPLRSCNVALNGWQREPRYFILNLSLDMKSLLLGFYYKTILQVLRSTCISTSI